MPSSLAPARLYTLASTVAIPVTNASNQLQSAVLDWAAVSPTIAAQYSSLNS